MHYIDAGFEQVINKLHEKRETLKEQFRVKYDQEEAKFTQKSDQLNVYNDAIGDIEAIY